MEQVKQNAIDESVKSARKNLSSGAIVTSNDEVIAWMADKIERLEKKRIDLLKFIADGVDREDGMAVAIGQRQEQLKPTDSNKFFCYDHESGFDTYDTKKEAKESAQRSIDYYRDKANEGWDEDVTQVCWGEIKQTATIFDSKPLTDELRSELNIVSSCDTYCDYQLT